MLGEWAWTGLFVKDALEPCGISRNWLLWAVVSWVSPGSAKPHMSKHRTRKRCLMQMLFMF